MRPRYSFGTQSFHGAFLGWAWQDFAAGTITGTSVTLTANENGTAMTGFEADKIVASSAVITQADTTGANVYTGTTKLFSSKVTISTHSSTSVTLSGVPHISWGDVRIWYMYTYSYGVPVNYTIAPKHIQESVWTEAQALFATHEEIESATFDAVFNSIENTPIGASTSSTGSFTSLTADDGVLTTIDINGGTIDGTAIGRSSRSTGAFSGLNIIGSAYISDVTEFSDGSAAAPSIAFRNDDDTGFYEYGTNSIGFASGGACVGRITPTHLIHTGTVYGDYLFASTGIYASDQIAGTSTENYVRFIDNGPPTGWLTNQDNTFDLGSSSYKWKDLYIGSSAYIGNLTLADGSIQDSSDIISLNDNRLVDVGVFSSGQDPFHNLALGCWATIEPDMAGTYGTARGLIVVNKHNPETIASLGDGIRASYRFGPESDHALTLDNAYAVSGNIYCIQHRDDTGDYNTTISDARVFHSRLVGMAGRSATGGTQTFTKGHHYYAENPEGIDWEATAAMGTQYGYFCEDLDVATTNWGLAIGESTGMDNYIYGSLSVGKNTVPAEALDVSGNVKATSFIIGANTLDTTEWAYLDGLDQALKTTDAVTFSNITLYTGFIHYNDSDTYMSFAADDQLTFTAGGVQMMKFYEAKQDKVTIGDEATPTDLDLLVATVGAASTIFCEGSSGNVGIGTKTLSAKCHVDQSVTDAAIPVLYLDQADVSEEMIEFNTTIGVGNAIEAAGGKALTTTHFIKVTLPGALTRYIPCGTIA